LRTVKQR